MKIRIADTFSITETEVNCLIEKHNLTVEGNNRRDPIRELFVTTLRELIKEATVGMEDKIKKERSEEKSKAFAKIIKFSKDSGEDFDSILAELLERAKNSSAPAADSEDSDEDSEEETLDNSDDSGDDDDDDGGDGY